MKFDSPNLNQLPQFFSAENFSAVIPKKFFETYLALTLYNTFKAIEIEIQNFAIFLLTSSVTPNDALFYYHSRY